MVHRQENQNQQQTRGQNDGKAYAQEMVTGDHRRHRLWNPLNVNTGANQRGNVCFECGAQGHFNKDYPKLKNNNNRGNRVGNAKA
ncbi:putative reverse transcriptase domain-containing protein [Tanacetum coccineum]|uniref:Reverse transcriptase domain-containing protein n=1 Tax=Tanacetum coccineum TaxID=301880 RepID=A0ABQ4Z629_9ASTR